MTFMSERDIVERLRHRIVVDGMEMPGNDSLHREAADVIDDLRERLEVWPVDPNTGEFIKTEMLPSHMDGIACRDETIVLLEKKIERLGQTLKEVEKEALDYVDSYTFYSNEWKIGRRLYKIISKGLRRS